MRYEGNIYRPPVEEDSYLLQCTVGCSNNKCTFCGMFKDKKFRVRPLDEIIRIIRQDARYIADNGLMVKKVFLCDGDAIVVRQNELLAILNQLHESFPGLEQINTYAGPRSTMTKSVADLQELHRAGLYRAYLGVETGSDYLLEKTKKGVNAEQMLQAGLRLKEGGLDLFAIILLGLGGKEKSDEHISETARMLNAMQPQHVSAMTYMPVEGTEMYNDILRGDFKVLDSTEVLSETKSLIQKIEVPLHFTSQHASNYLMLDGHLPEDKERFCNLIDAALKGDIRTRSERYRGL